MSKIIIFKGFWKIEDVKKLSNCLFIYGDNDIGKGKGGQAIIRDLPNAMGIPTKKYPSNKRNAFYSDEELEQNKIKINKAIDNIIKYSKDFEYVILPENGLGTGLSDLPNKAPKTFKYLNESIELMKKRI